MDKKALIAMSGGVDSAVAAYLMSDKEFECFGVTMRLGSDKFCHKQSCLTEKDIEDAKNVSEKLGMPFMVVDFSDRFKKSHGISPLKFRQKHLKAIEKKKNV